MEKVNYQYAFEKLEVWKMSKDFVKKIYQTTKSFPDNERFGLVSQVNRAAVSVPSTIAEGSARVSRNDQAHYSQMAYGSLMEVACQLLIAFELGYINEEQHTQLRKDIERISRSLNSLRNYQTRDVFFNRLNRSTTQPLNR